MSSTSNQPSRLHRHYERRTAALLVQFNDIRDLLTSHEGSKGARVEKLVRGMLTDHLPKLYDYASGVVIDSKGGEVDFSRQQDLLIVDKLFQPRIFLDEEPSVYPVETIYAGIEVKTSLGSDHRELRDAFEKIASLRQLKFIEQSVAQNRGGMMGFGSTTPPLGMVFAFESDTRNAETLLDHAQRAAEGIDESLWPSVVCILNRGIILHDPKERRLSFFHAGYLMATEAGPQEAWTTDKSAPHADIDGKRYPTVRVGGNNGVVDPARVFTIFLANALNLVQGKAMPERTNVLVHYIPERYLRVVQVFRSTGPGTS